MYTLMPPLCDSRASTSEAPPPPPETGTSPSDDYLVDSPRLSLISPHESPPVDPALTSASGTATTVQIESFQTPVLDSQAAVLLPPLPQDSQLPAVRSPPTTNTPEHVDDPAP